MTPVYLDHAATTPVDRDIAELAAKYMTREFYNPSSMHVLGQRAFAAIDRAREQCAAAIGGDKRGIVFTSGGTEAINQAMKCIPTPERIAVSAIEHDAVIACAEKLESRGVKVDYIEPDENGVITDIALAKVLRRETELVCVMSVNNVTGVIQPIESLARTAHSAGALFFTDAVQAVNGTRIDAAKTDVDMLCVSAHKFYAPKGAGFLYVKPGVRLRPFIAGGEQEGGLRAGTHDVPAIVAMGEAIMRAAQNVDCYAEHIRRVSGEFIKRLKFGEIVAANAPRTDDIISVVFDGIDGNRLAVALSMAGVCCSVGSACSAGSQTPPRALAHMPVKAENAVRFSFGKRTSVAQAVVAAKIVNETVARFNR